MKVNVNNNSTKSQKKAWWTQTFTATEAKKFQISQ